MMLLGTTSKDETIQMIKEYASTSSGLQLIKDYLSMYIPEPSSDRSDNDINETTYFDEDEKYEMNGSSDQNASEIEEDKDNKIPVSTTTEAPIKVTPAQEGGFLNRLKSMFSFDSTSTEAPRTFLNKVNNLEMPVFANPTFVNPIVNYPVSQYQMPYNRPVPAPVPVGQGPFVHVKYPVNGFMPITNFVPTKSSTSTTTTTTESPVTDGSDEELTSTTEELEMESTNAPLTIQQEIVAEAEDDGDFALKFNRNMLPISRADIMNGPQRISPYDFYASGVIHRVNPDDIRLLFDIKNESPINQGETGTNWS
jgi:hypothetical protein